MSPTTTPDADAPAYTVEIWRGRFLEDMLTADDYEDAAAEYETAVDEYGSDCVITVVNRAGRVLLREHGAAGHEDSP